MDGNPAPHDILNIMGVEALADKQINKINNLTLCIWLCQQ